MACAYASGIEKLFIGKKCRKAQYLNKNYAADRWPWPRHMASLKIDCSEKPSAFEHDLVKYNMNTDKEKG